MTIILTTSVAIIGGGPSGLASAKEAKDCGLIPTVFEKDASIGGVWKPEEGKVWDSLKINNSRYSSSFSDFPWDENQDFFPNAKEVYQYLCDYADHFQLQKNTKLHCEVTKLTRLENKWLVEWIKDKGQVETSLFDSVIVCSGIYSKGYIPYIQNLDKFNGSVIHSEEYKNPNPFEGKRVAIIGNSFSGTEIAAEVALTAKKVYHVFHRPYWLLSRYRKEKGTQKTIPFDLLSFKRCNSSFNETDEQYNERINKTLYTLCSAQFKIDPNLSISTSLKEYPFITTSDTYLSRVQKGWVTPKKGTVQQIDGNTLYLTDGSSIEVDSIIFSTGYVTNAPFFDQEMLEELEFEHEPSKQPFILNNIFHPKFPNMAFIGLSRYTIFFGIVELQARLASMTLSGQIPWPTQSMMQAGINEAREFRSQKIGSQHRFSNHMLVCENLAKEIGALPDFAKIKDDNPILYDQLINGPFTTASYRLCGFGENKEISLKVLRDINSRVENAPQGYELYFHD